MSIEICDIHSHILPGVDDGAKDMEETLQALREAAAQGVGTVIATPHFHPGRYLADAGAVLACWKRVRAECRKQEIPIQILPGQECLYYSGLLDALDEGSALTLAGSEYVLVEFAPECLYSYMMQGLRELLQNGYRPVLAHMERYGCLRREDHLKTLKEQGVLLQMNFDTLLPGGGLFHKNKWRELLRRGYVDLLGSDCHGMDFRPYQIHKCLRWLEKSTDPALLDRMLEENVRKILANGQSK